jgi:hypothetical protein
MSGTWGPPTMMSEEVGSILYPRCQMRVQNHHVASRWAALSTPQWKPIPGPVSILSTLSRLLVEPRQTWGTEEHLRSEPGAQARPVP